MRDLTYAGKIKKYPVIVKKNKPTDFITSVSEAVRGLFLPPPKLHPQKNVTLLTDKGYIDSFTVFKGSYLIVNKCPRFQI